MSFLRKLCNYIYLKEQQERVSLFAPIAAAAGVITSPDDIFIELSKHTLDCRRWTLDEANAWRERMLSLAREAKEGAPTVGLWGDYFMNPAVTFSVDHVTTLHKAVMVDGEWVSSSTGVNTYQGTLEWQTSTYSTGLLSATFSMPLSAAVRTDSDEKKLLVNPNQYAVDVPAVILGALPDLDGVVGSTVAGFLKAHMVYDESVDEPMELEDHTRLYSTFGYFVPGLATALGAVSAGDVVLFKQLGVATLQASDITDDKVTVSISRQAYPYSHAVPAQASAPTQVRWQPSLPSYKIAEIEALGAAVYLVRTGDTSALGVSAAVNTVLATGLRVTELVECGSHYLVRGVKGGFPMAAGSYSLCIVGACKDIHLFSDSHMGGYNAQKIMNGAYTWHSNYILGSGTRVETRGKVQRVFLGSSETTHKEMNSFEHPAAALVDMLLDPFTSPADVLKVKYLALVWRDLRDIQTAGYVGYMADLLPGIADTSSAKGLLLDDGSICAIGRYSAAAVAVDDQSILWRCQLYSAHGERVSARDGTLPYNPDSGYITERAWYIDSHQPAPTLFTLSRWFKLDAMSVVTTFGRKYTFLPDTSPGSSSSADDHIVVPLIAPPADFVTVADKYADLGTVAGARAYVLTPGTGTNAPAVTYRSDAGTVAWGSVLVHEDGDKLKLTKKYLLGASSAVYDTPADIQTIYTNPGSTFGNGDTNIELRSAFGKATTVINRPGFEVRPLLGFQTGFAAARISVGGQYSTEDLQVYYFRDEQDIKYETQVREDYGNTTTTTFLVGSVCNSPDDVRFPVADYTIPAAGPFTSITPLPERVLSKQTARTNEQTPVPTNLDSGNTHIIGLDPIVFTRGWNSNGGCEPMELFPLCPSDMVYQYDVSTFGYGLGGQSAGLLRGICIRLCMVGHRRKVVHGESSAFHCYNKCPERGTVTVEEDGVYYTPTAVGFDILIGIPSDPLGVPVVLPVRVVSATSEDVPELLYMQSLSDPPFRQTKHLSLMSSGVAFPTATTVDGVTTTRWRVGLDSLGNSPNVTYEDIVSYHTKNELITLPAAPVLAQLFVPTEDTTFDIPVGVAFPEHAAAHLFLQISCGTSVGVHPLALVRPLVAEGQVIFRVNKAMFTPVAAKLLGPRVFFSLVDSRWMKAVHVVSAAHP